HSPEAPWSARACGLALAANWFGDSLDGTLARVRDQQRPRYGYYVDHVIDLAGAAALFAGIAASGLMQMWIALALAAAFFLVSAESYLATHARGLFRLSFAGFGPTELRLVLAAGAVADGRCQSRAIRFVIVGAIGFVVQIAALWALTVLGGWRWLPATLAAVEVAVVHNFLWHDRWTWPAGAGSRRSILGRFVAFN